MDQTRIDWFETGFNDDDWSIGNAELGYGDGDEATVVDMMMMNNNKYITTYFRHHSSVIILKIFRS